MALHEAAANRCEQRQLMIIFICKLSLVKNASQEVVFIIKLYLKEDILMAERIQSEQAEKEINKRQEINYAELIQEHLQISRAQEQSKMLSLAEMNSQVEHFEFLKAISSLSKQYFGRGEDFVINNFNHQPSKLEQPNFNNQPLIIYNKCENSELSSLQLLKLEQLNIDQSKLMEKKLTKERKSLEDRLQEFQKQKIMLNQERQRYRNLILNYQNIASLKQTFYEIVSMNAKVLSLQCKDQKQRLTVFQITEFLKIPLLSVEIINLKGNCIGDQGVKALCQANYDNLREIDLSDNGISIMGVSHLINNSWDKEIDYKLENVITKDGGYALKAGENIKTIKAILKDHTKIDLYMIDQLEQKEKRKLYRAMHFLMEIPLEGRPQQTKQQSDEVFKQLKESVKSQPISIHQVLLTLKEILKRQVTFSRKTNVKSQMTIKILTSGVESQNIMIKHQINDYQWSFKTLKNNSDKIAQFVQWYKLNLLHDYGADLQDLTIHKITEGSINVWMSVSPNNNISNIDID